MGNFLRNFGQLVESPTEKYPKTPQIYYKTPTNTTRIFRLYMRRMPAMTASLRGCDFTETLKQANKRSIYMLTIW